MEYDDTSGFERIHQRHRTGTSYEIDASGNKVEIIKGESYRLLSNKEQEISLRQVSQILKTEIEKNLLISDYYYYFICEMIK